MRKSESGPVIYDEFADYSSSSNGFVRGVRTEPDEQPTDIYSEEYDEWFKRHYDVESGVVQTGDHTYRVFGRDIDTANTKWTDLTVRERKAIIRHHFPH